MAQTRSGPCSPPQVSGYPAAICDRVPGSKYLCCNCDHILKEALQTLCGHRYCSACLAWILRSGKSPVCPVCAEDPGALTGDSYLSEDKAFSDTAINKEISELQVHCVMAGCRWSGVLSEYEDHQGACDFGAIHCHTGCGARLQRRLLAEHLERDCRNSPSLWRISRNQSPEHDCEETPKEPTPRAADPPTKRPHAGPADCRFAPLGCCYRGSRDKMEEHERLAAAAHVSLVLPVLLQMQNGPPAAALTENGFCDYNGAAQKSPTRFHNGESDHDEIATDCGHHNGGVTGSHLISRVCELETRIQVAENIIMVMNREIDHSNAKLTAALEQMDEEQHKVRACEAKIADLSCTIAKKDVQMNELQKLLVTLEQTTYDGIFLWKISDLTRKCQDASDGRTISLYSPAFYTAKYGYKVCLRVYLNGDGAGKGTHISLFFTIMKGEYDVLLPWPFRHKVTFLLLDQNNREHVIDAFRPDPASISFHRPVGDMNIASGCPLFCPLSKLQAPRNNYVRDDTLFIRCIIDTN